MKRFDGSNKYIIFNNLNEIYVDFFIICILFTQKIMYNVLLNKWSVKCQGLGINFYE